MRRSNTHDGDTERGGRGTPRKVLLFIVVGLIACAAGLGTGKWWQSKSAAIEKGRRVDEYTGLGDRTGIAGDLALFVQPMRLSIKPGQPVKVRLVLTNKGKRPMFLSKRLSPAPAAYESNQLPLKVTVTRNGLPVEYRGDPVLYPPHTKRDFFRLDPGRSRHLTVDLSAGPQGGRWDMSAPGEYVVEAWYETYLTGRYIGVNAWTGMSNHVVLQVTVR